VSQEGLFGSKVDRGKAKRRVTDEPVYNRVLGCKDCDLSATRWPVPYRGPVPAKVAIVGEAPGQTEDARGGPFLGPAGQLLQEQFRIHKVIPERLFWMNTVSCFPPSKPSRKHIAACNGNVWAQLRLASPTWVVLVGGVALGALAPWELWKCKPKGITEMRGRVWTWEGMHWSPIIHPAAALRESRYKTYLEQDITRLVRMLRSNEPDYSTQCLICGREVHRYDYSGMPFCAPHYRDVEFGENKGARVEGSANLRDGSSARTRAD
jgi:uracil-DNA glycosylase family 4